MKRKNKVMLALAIGAVVIVVGSGVARCTLAPTEEAAAPESEASQSSSQAASEIGGEPESQWQAGAQGGFADLKNTSWESEDGKSALSIIDGAFIESDEAGQRILYYTVDEEEQSSSELTATLSVSTRMTGDEEKTVAIVHEYEGGTRTIACDKLACAYFQKAQAATEITLADATDDLYGVFGKGEDDFGSALLEYASANTPSASTATWNKEVWIDFGSGTIITNFTLNDAAATIVTIQKDSSGKLGAL